MARIVMKFGGTSVANLDRIRAAAAFVRREVDAGHSVAVVVSAMAGETNFLVSLCKDAGEPAPARDARNVEYDAVVASGEQVTCGLLALVMQALHDAAVAGFHAGAIFFNIRPTLAGARLFSEDGFTTDRQQQSPREQRRRAVALCGKNNVHRLLPNLV